MTDNPAKYFDKILGFLAKDFNRIFNYSDVFDHMHPRKKGKKAIFTPPIKSNDTTNFINALDFLESEDLLRYSSEEGQIQITTPGFIKVKTNSFQKQINDAKWTMRIQRFNQIATPLIAIAALLFSLWSFFKKDVNPDRKINGCHAHKNAKENICCFHDVDCLPDTCRN